MQKDIQGREKGNLYQDPGKIKVYENEIGYARYKLGHFDVKKGHLSD